MGRSESRKRRRSSSRNRALEKRTKRLENQLKDMEERLAAFHKHRARSPFRRVTSSPQGSARSRHSRQSSLSQYSKRSTNNHSSSREASRPCSNREPSSSHSRYSESSSPGNSTSHLSVNNTNCNSEGRERDPDNINIQSTQAKEQDNPDTILEIELDPATLECLGEDPSSNKTGKVNLHPAIVSRWKHILSKGGEKQTKAEIMEKYPIPSNLQTLKAPLLNPEVVPLLNEQGLKREKRLLNLQDCLGSGISALGVSLNTLLKDPESERRSLLLNSLSDAGKLCSNVHYLLSMERRSNISPGLAKAAREIAFNSEVDEYLLGKDFGDKFKNAKLVEKSSQELKPVNTLTTKKDIPVVTRKAALNRQRPFHVSRDVRRQGRQPQVRHQIQSQTRYRRSR